MARSWSERKARGGSTFTPGAEGPAGLYRPEAWTPADEIGIAGFRQVLFWPLALTAKSIRDDDGPDGVRSAVAQVLAAIGHDASWEKAESLSDHASRPGEAARREGALREGAERPSDPGAQEAARAAQAEALSDEAHSYAEFVYFHDFVQSNLFGKQGERGDPPPVSLFRRRARLRLEAVIGGGEAERHFAASVERVNLYVYSTGAAMLVVEIDFGAGPCVWSAGGGGRLERRPMSLADVLDFQDRFRRVYAPFFATPFGKDPATAANWKPQLVVDRATFREVLADAPSYDPNLPEPKLDPEPAPDPALSLAHAAEGAARLGAPPVFAHWEALAAPLAIAGTHVRTPGSGEIVFRQVVDERLPTMSFVSLSGEGVVQLPGLTLDQSALMRVSRGDWARLCFADGAGEAELPYSHRFLENFEDECCYDRFFPSPVSPYLTSRILFSGYHMAIAGSGWFMDNVLVLHFRRHYFQLGLACHMEVASLLAASSRVTDAVRVLNGAADRARSRRAFEKKMQVIERDFLEFVHLFHFTGMSNQTQAAEMLALWRGRLGLPGLFDDVRSEIDTANQFLIACDQAEQAEATSRLNVVAAVGVVLGLALAFLGMNVLVGGPDASSPGFGDVFGWRVLGATVCAFAVLGLALAFALGEPARSGRRLDDWVLRAHFAVLVMGFVLFAAAGPIAALFC